MRISFIIFIFFASILFINVVSATAPLENIKYPIAELEDCKDIKNCYAYCEKPENISRCVDFGEKNKLISMEDALKARKFSNILKDGGPGKCTNQRTCEQYCSKKTNFSECLEFGKKFNLISENKLKQVEEGFKQAPLEMQSCFKSLINIMTKRAKNNETTNQGDFMSIIMQNCLPIGTKIPSEASKRINKESLKKMQEFYGNSLSPKDLESLKELQGVDDSLIPQGEAIPSNGSSLNMEDLNNLQQKMKEEYNKLTPEQLEWMKKAQEQGQFDNQTEMPINTGSGSGMGM
jgi:hypothetical protein